MSRHENAVPFRFLGKQQREPMVASATTPREKQELRETIELQTARYLAEGGKIDRRRGGTEFTRSHREVRVDEFGR